MPRLSCNWLGQLYRDLSSVQRSLVSALGGFLLYGGWALLINVLHGQSLSVAMRAGLVQGTYSFIVTFMMTIMLDVMYRWLLSSTGHVVFAAVLTVFIGCSALFSGSWYVNYVFGTPEIFNTVILGYVLGGGYSIAYTLGLARETLSRRF